MAAVGPQGDLEAGIGGADVIRADHHGIAVELAGAEAKADCLAAPPLKAADDGKLAQSDRQVALGWSRSW